MLFVQKLRRLALSIVALVMLEAIAMLICYKLGVLHWFLIIIAGCFISEAFALTISGVKNKENSNDIIR